MPRDGTLLAPHRASSLIELSSFHFRTENARTALYPTASCGLPLAPLDSDRRRRIFRRRGSRLARGKPVRRSSFIEWHEMTAIAISGNHPSPIERSSFRSAPRSSDDSAHRTPRSQAARPSRPSTRSLPVPMATRRALRVRKRSLPRCLPGPPNKGQQGFVGDQGPPVSLALTQNQARRRPAESAQPLTSAIAFH